MRDVGRASSHRGVIAQLQTCLTNSVGVFATLEHEGNPLSTQKNSPRSYDNDDNNDDNNDDMNNDG